MADTETQEPSADAGRQKTWMAELERAEKWMKEKYRDRCETLLARYEDERDEEASTKGKDRYNIFWANIETIKPLTYTKVPPAQALRRYPNDPDPIARIVAEVMERAINFSNDCYDFDGVLKDVRDEHILIARGQEWIRYVPQFEKLTPPGIANSEPKDKGVVSKTIEALKNAVGLGDTQAAAVAEPGEKLTYEEVVSEYVSYQDWGHNKCRKWKEVRFVYRKCYLNRAALVEYFGKDKGEKCTLNHKPPENDKSVPAEERERFAQALVYEVWDKPSKKVIHVSDGYPGGLLKEVDDPLGLKHFWPFPMPAYGTLSPRSLAPIPDYCQYQDLCKELDRHTQRIGILTKALRMVGVYAGEEKHKLQQIFKGTDSENVMIPVEDWAVWADKGGMKGVMEWVPIDKVAQVLGELYKARELTIAAIYQICGIPDIMRGDTESDETAAAQNLKSTWGSSRMSEKQKEMARFCRDDYRIKGEIIAKKFSIETIKTMTGYPLLTQQEKRAAQAHLEAVEMAKKLHEQRMQQMAPPPMPGQPPAPPPQMDPPILPPPPLPPEKMALVDKPTWEEVDAFLKSDAMRLFRIDIEANSTVEPDMIAARRDASEFATAFGKLIGESFEIVKAAPPFGKVVAAAARYLCTKYEMGREMEEVIEKALSEIGALTRQPTEQELAAQEGKGKGKSPEELAIMQQQVDATREATAVKGHAVQADAMNSQADAQTNAMHAENDRIKIESEARMAAMEQSMRKMEALIEALTRDKEAKIDGAARAKEADAVVEAARESRPAPSAP